MESNAGDVARRQYHVRLCVEHGKKLDCIESLLRWVRSRCPDILRANLTTRCMERGPFPSNRVLERLAWYVRMPSPFRDSKTANQSSVSAFIYHNLARLLIINNIPISLDPSDSTNLPDVGQEEIDVSQQELCTTTVHLMAYHTCSNSHS